MQTTANLGEIIEEFLNDSFLGKNTSTQYFNMLAYFHCSLEANGMDKMNVRIEYIRWFSDDLISKNRTDSTRYNYLIVLKKFFKWLYFKKYHSIDLGTFIKLPKRSKGWSRRPLYPDQVDLMLKAIDRTTPKGQRDYIIINMMLSLGLRVVEVSRINVEDLKCSGKMFIQGKGKTDKKDFVCISEKLIALIMNYLSDFNLCTSPGPMFISLSRNNKGKRLSSQSISSVVRDALRNVGIKDRMITPHSLRHTTATMLVIAGYNDYQIQLHMRHSSPTITRLYTRFVEDELRSKENLSKNFDSFIKNT